MKNKTLTPNEKRRRRNEYMREYYQTYKYRIWRRKHLFKKKHPEQSPVAVSEDGNEKWKSLQKLEMLYYKNRGQAQNRKETS